MELVEMVATGLLGLETTLLGWADFLEGLKKRSLCVLAELYPEEELYQKNKNFAMS